MRRIFSKQPYIIVIVAENKAQIHTDTISGTGDKMLNLELPNVALVVLGLGAQGPRLLKHFDAFVALARLNGYNLLLVGAIDPNGIAWEEARRTFPSLFNSAYIQQFDDTNDLSSMLSYFLERAKTKQFKACMIYDASPTHFHWRNLRKIVEFEERAIARSDLSSRFFFYFGEKPILSFSEERYSDYDAAFSKSLIGYPHWCNFIELHNPAYLTAKSFLNGNCSDIKEIRFIRFSCVGLERFILDKRHGVTGGSFMDKSIHDIPLMYDLCGDCQTIIQKSRVLWHMPALLSPSPRSKSLALSLSGETYKLTSRLPPAEGHSHIVLSCANDWSTQVSFISSWLGIPIEERKVIKQLAGRFDVEAKKCIARKTMLPRELRSGYVADEARLIWIRGVTKHGRDIEILANLLARDKSAGWSHSISPWVRVYEASKVISLPVDEKADALRAIFLSVLSEVVSRLNAQDDAAEKPYGHAASVRAHRLAKSVRDHMSEEFEKSGRLSRLEQAREQAYSMLRAPYCFAKQPGRGGRHV